MHALPSENGRAVRPTSLARIMHETPSRDPGDGWATGQPQGLGPEAYLSVRRKVRDPRTPGRTTISAVAAGGSCIMRVNSRNGFRGYFFSFGGLIVSPILVPGRTWPV
jgi:hypothetical protein